MNAKVFRTAMCGLLAVAQAAEALHRANQLEMGAVEMNKRWLALENALNAWRAAALDGGNPTNTTTKTP